MKIKYKLTPEEFHQTLLAYIEQNKRLSENELLYPDTRNFHYQIANYQKELIERFLLIEKDD